MKRVLFSEQQKQRMKNMYELESLSLQRIAMNFGVSTPMIAALLREMGVTIRSRGRRRTRTSTEETPAPRREERDVPIFDWN